jgi:HSP20 family molecular chaperone IbpA
MGKKKGGDQGKNPEEMEDINAFINKLFNELIENQQGGPPQEGAVYRFDISVNKDGVTITPNSAAGGQQVQSVKVGEEPLVDIITKKDAVTVIAELPRAAKKDIKLHADNERLSIESAMGKEKYSKLVTLPMKVDPTTALAVHNNGILEVTFKKSEIYSGVVRITLK